MNFFEGRNMAQFCAHCNGVMLGDMPRQIIDSRVYHLSCGWKLEQEAIRRISDNVNTVEPPKDETGAQPLHWVSQQ